MPGPGRPFQKGNTFGRGPRQTYASKIRKAIEGSGGAKDIRAVFDALIEKAKKGDVQAARLVLEHTAGKPAQRVEISDDRPAFDTDEQRAALAALYAGAAGDDDAAGVDLPEASTLPGAGGDAADVQPQDQPADR